MGNKRRILVVDDSAVNRALLKEIFGDQFQVTEAADGISALNLLLKGNHRLQAVLLDIGMPGLDGFEVLRRIRAESSLSNLPVVMVTASNDAKSEAKALRLGATDFVTKPYVPEVIRRRVNNAVEKYLLEESLSSQALQELTRRADFDPLTGIYNKSAFYRVTRDMLDEHPEQAFALVRWNVERFKLINDLHGQEMGDWVLQEIATCLKEILPLDSICGRLTADHFAVCVPQSELRPAEWVKEVTRRFCGLGIDHDIFVDAAVYEIEDPSLPVSQMCDRADLALQTINGKYNHHVAYYTSELRSGILREQDIRNQMGDALRLKQFHVYFQPVCSLSTGQPLGAEALVRWIHPERGIISPGEFIPLFEKSGFITELDRYVWEEVCRYLSWRREQGLAPLPISVNASRASLYNSSFCEEIMALTSRYGVEPRLFKIEITETAYADNPGQILKSTQKLQSAGYAILMDDFGSGYSSLNTLKDIPVDTLKIDMKFLQGFEEGGRVGTVLISVLRMARWLNTPVIAEGVETAAQMAFLRSVGCDWIQGYCFARPMPPEEFEVYVAQSSPPALEEKNTAFTYQDFDLLMGGNQLINRLMEGVFGGFGLYEFSGDRIEAIRVNDGYYDILGLTPAAIHSGSSNILDSLSPEDRETAKAACRETIRTGRTVRCTLRRQHRVTGHTLHLDCLFRQLGSSENTALLCVAFNDITDRLEAEARMRKEQERYRIIMERTGAIVVEWDLVHHTFNASQGFEQFAVSGEDPFALLEQDSSMGGLSRPDMDNGVLTLERPMHRTDGSTAWYRLVRTDVRDEEGRLLRVVGTVTDIDREKRARLELEETSGRLQTLLDTIPAGVVSFTADRASATLTPEYYSIGRARMLGYTQEELMSLCREDPYALVHPEDRDRVAAAHVQAVRTGREMDLTFRQIGRDGQAHWVRATCRLLVTGEQQAQLFSVYTDMDALMEVQQSLIYRDQLSQLLLADSNTATLDYQAETDLLQISYLDGEGKRSVLSMEQYLAVEPKGGYAESCADVRDVLREVLQSGAEQSHEGRYNLDGKGWRWYSCVLTGIRDSRRRVVRVVGTLRDISEQRKARSRYQEQMAVNASLSANLLSAYRVNLSRMQVEYRWSRVNAPDLSGEDILQEAHFREGCRAFVGSPDAAEQCYETFSPAALRQKFEEGESSVSLDYRMQTENGSLRWASTQAKLMCEPESGDLMVFYNTWDITGQHLVRALVDSVVQADYDFLMCVDPRDGSYVLFPNQVRATIHLRDKSGDYESARRRDMLDAILPEDQARWLRDLTIPHICRALEQAPRCEIRFRLREQDGSIAHKQAACTWLDAERSAIMICRTDITEQVQQEAARSETLRQALEKAEEAGREKDRFLSRTSYEIRTPMNAIIGMSGLALAESKTPDQVKNYLHKIQYAGEYMLTLVSDILDVAQVESGNFFLTPAPCSLQDCVEQLVTLVQPSADSRGIHFQLNSSQVQVRAAMMDKIRVLQAFVNLLTAVMQYTAEGGSVSCTMSQIPSEGNAFVLRTVVRSGTGLSQDSIDRMFEPFALERSKLSGSGLELTLAKRLLEAMGGTISVSSQGADTALMAELPLQEAELPLPSGTLPTLSGDFNFSGRRILVAEDQAINTEVARRLLEQKQFTVETAVNGLEAVSCFESHDPGWYSAILMDVRMPVLDGLAATRKIRQLNRSDARTIPILAMTGNAFASDVQASLASGMDAHLEKPINPHLLYQTLAALIFAREDQQKNRETEKRIRQQERIYKLLLAQSRSQVFDYDAAEDQLTISASGEGHDDVSVAAEFVRRVLPACAAIHPDYRQAVGRLLSDETEDSEGELLFLGDFNNTGYRWYNAYYKRLNTGGHDRVVGRIDDVDEKTRRTLTLQEKAEFDPITNLYNRATFQELVQNALNGRNPEIDGVAAFVEFDLDNFKLVNDTCGHLMGDRLLKTVGETVRSCCRREDLVGRLGGDEFAIWMEDVGNVDNVTEKIRQLARKFREATAHLQLGTEVTASFGIAMTAPSDKTFEALFQKADVAMYQAKRKGKHCWSVFGSQAPET